MKKRRIFGPLYVILTLLVMYLPVAVVVVYSFNASKYGVWTGFTLDWYKKLASNRALLTSLGNSLLLAAMSVFSAAVIGTLGALGMARSRFRAKGLLENVTLMPMMIPEIILGMAYLSTFTFMGLKFGMGTLVLAHTTFCVPYILVNVQSRLAGMDPALAEAARDLGASPLRAFWDVTLPLIMPAVLSGSLLAAAMSMDDVVISFFVTGTGVNTLPVQVYSLLKVGISPDVNALCTVMLGVLLLGVAVFGVIRHIHGKSTENGAKVYKNGGNVA